VSQPEKVPFVLHQWMIDRLQESYPDWNGKMLGGAPVVLPKKITAMDMIREKIRETKPIMGLDDDRS